MTTCEKRDFFVLKHCENHKLHVPGLVEEFKMSLNKFCVAHKHE